MTENKKQVVTPKARVAFPHLFEKEEFEGGTPKYSITLLFPKDTDLSKLKEAAKMAIAEKWPKRPKGIKSPFKDGDAVDEDGDLLYPYDGYEGHIALKCSTEYEIGVVDAKRATIVDPDEVYGGCYGRAYVVAFAYERKTSRGVSFALVHFQKLADGEKFGNRVSAQDAFDDDVSETNEASDAFGEEINDPFGV